MDQHRNQPVPSPNPATAVGSTLVEGVVFASASRTATTYTSEAIYNPNCRGVRLYIVNDNANSGTVTAKIQVRVPSTGTWVDLPNATSAAVGSSTGTVLTIYPGLTGIADAAGSMINQFVGPVWRVHMTVGTGTCTNAVYADYLL